MQQSNILLAVMVITPSIFNVAIANESAPWGSAKESHQKYSKQHVVYDLDAKSEGHLSNIISRAGYLSKLNGNDPFDNKIIVVIHGNAIPFFSINQTNKYRKIMELAYSQTLNEIIEFRMCSASAKLQGFISDDIHGFITMVPMADAEIVRLQSKGYAYMR